MGPLRGRASESRGHSVPREPPSGACPSTSSPRCACCSRGAETTESGEKAPPFIAGDQRGRLSAPRTGPPQPGDGPPRPPSPPSGREGTTWATRLSRLAAHMRESGFLPRPGPSPGRWARVSPFPEGARNCQALSPHKFRASREPLGPALHRSRSRIPRGPAPSCRGRCRGPRLHTWAGASKSAWKTWLMYVDCSIVRAKVYF